jgi:uncharacterized protein (DUF488 family)
MSHLVLAKNSYQLLSDFYARVLTEKISFKNSNLKGFIENSEEKLDV